MFIRCFGRLASCGALVVAVACSVLPNLAHAHGALIKYKMAPAVALQAMYDDGEPMAKAQIIVYAPSNPVEPWLTAMTDEKGHFTFVPDQSIHGEWAVQARQAGHGAMAHINIGGDAASSDDAADTPNTGTEQIAAAQQTSQMQSTGHTPMQRWLMTASVIWGFIGTGLFFSRKRKS